MFGGKLAVLQAPIFDGLLLDPISLFDDGRGPAELDIRGRHVVQALMVALMIVVLDHGLEVAGQEVILQHDAIIQGLVPAFDLVPGLRVQRSAADMAHVLGFDVLGQFARDVARAFVAEQPGLVQHRGAVAA